jgi:ABC-2 type transport system ATP-binding protein
VRALRENGTTIILTTHYIEEAEEMADRVGVINQGELVLVEDKTTLMRKLGKRQLSITMQTPLEAVPPALSDLPLEIAEAGHALVYTYDVQREETGIAALLKRLGEQGIEFKDLNTSESSLEDIFVSLVRNGRAEVRA